MDIILNVSVPIKFMSHGRISAFATSVKFGSAAEEEAKNPSIKLNQ
jgi:hypothetical protein